MKKILVVLFALVFCFWFGEVVVNATPPSNPFEINAEFKEKQDINNILITVYHTDNGSSYIDIDADVLYDVTIVQKSSDNNHVHQDVDIFNAYSNNETYKCDKGCIVDITNLEDYLNSQDAYFYDGKYYTHKKVYNLPKEMFTSDEGKLILHFGEMKHYKLDDTYYSAGSIGLELDYKIENGFIYLYGQENTKNSNSMSCK